MLALIALALGVLLTVSAIILLFARPERAESKIHLFGQRLEIPAPALVVMLAGVALVALPFAFPERGSLDRIEGFLFGPDLPGLVLPVGIGERQGNENGTIILEKRPTDGHAVLIHLNTVVRGTVAGPKASQRDESSDAEHWFVFDNQELRKIRVILRKILAGRPELHIYDEHENQLDRFRLGSDVNAGSRSLAIRSKYYVLVKPMSEYETVNYELELRPEA